MKTISNYIYKRAKLRVSSISNNELIFVVQKSKQKLLTSGIFGHDVENRGALAHYDVYPSNLLSIKSRY